MSCSRDSVAYFTKQQALRHVKLVRVGLGKLTSVCCIPAPHVLPRDEPPNAAPNAGVWEVLCN